MSYLYKPPVFQLSNSSINLGDDCAKKLFVSRFFPQKRDLFSSVPAEVGTALHHGYQNYVEFGDKDQAIFAMMQSYPLEENPDPKDYRSLEATYATLKEMFESPVLQPFEPVYIKVNGETKCATEVPFQINFKGLFLDAAKTIPISYVGYIDLILFDRSNNRYIVVDIKTHRNNKEDLSGEYIFDGQCLPYGLALEQLLGSDIKNGIEVIYLSCYIDMKDPKVKAYKQRKTYEDIQNWIHRVHLLVRNYQYMYETEFWPRTNQGRTCMNWNSKCPVLSFCNLQSPEAIYKHIYADGLPESTRDEFKPWIEFDLAVV